MLRATRRWPKLIPRSPARRPGRSPRASTSTAATGSSPTGAEIRFTEMEYAIPRAERAGGGPAGDRVDPREPLRGCMPIEMPGGRAGDDALLSPSHERETTYIAVHQYRGMEWRPYFEAVEEIMDSYGGRPHWGKRHFQTAATLAPRYPRWAEFAAARDELDPGRVFANEYATASSAPDADGSAPVSAVGTRGRSGPRRGRWGPGRRSRRPRPGRGSRSARRARRPWRGGGRRGRRSRSPSAASPSSGVCTSPAPSSGSSRRPSGSHGDGQPRGVAAAGGEVAAAERGRRRRGAGLRTIGSAKPAAGVRVKRL